jgi:aspartate oxidase
MKKQRICIVGDGLSGLMTALALNKLEGLEVHLISKKNKHSKDKEQQLFLLLTMSFLTKS